MKSIKNLLAAVLTACALGGIAHADEAGKETKVKCVATSGEGTWFKGEVGYASGLKQALYHFSATGAYMVVDVLCNFEECVGFLNGVPAKGKIETSPSGPLKVTGVEIKTPLAARFKCQ